MDKQDNDQPTPGFRQLLRDIGHELSAAVRQGLADGLEQAKRERAARATTAAADEPVDVTRVLRRSRKTRDMQA